MINIDFKTSMANIAIMSTLDIYALHPLRELPSSPASELKNAFKGVFKQALEVGAVSITRNRKREAVLLSAELYEQLIAELAERDPLNVLREDYNARFGAMQTDKAQEQYDAAFDASPEELGKEAVQRSADR